jgi:hypothetical protein
MRGFIAIIIGVYLLPIPSEDFAPMGALLLPMIRSGALFTPHVLMIVGLAALYQFVCGYCLYRLFELSVGAIIIYIVPLVLLLWALLLIAINGPQGIAVLFDKLHKILFI